ncbi:MAG: D-glycero-beta-D-manno-heptose-7-phosphate kinase [Acidobacteria bacterium]|nr:D-glycero-beta-D-manno-heptose-7-phosphate kinase [Acidobacteriota bacterium]
MKLPKTFSDLKIAVIGDVMLDRYWWGNVTRISPEAPVPVVKLVRTSIAAGGAANVAANIAGLGATAYLVGITGKDTDAEILRNLVNEEPLIDCRFYSLEDRNTTVKTRIVAHDQQVVRLDQETTEDIEPKTANDLLERIKPIIEDVDVVLISDYAKGFLTIRLTEDLISFAKVSGKPILVDPKGKDYSKYRGATLLTPNKLEAANACGLEPETADLIERSGETLLRELALDALLITRGGEGMTLLQKSKDSQHFAATARTVYDVTGAGDTVIATLATAIASGLTLEDASRLANIAAGLVVEEVGTSSIGLTELTNAVESLESLGQ